MVLNLLERTLAVGMLHAPQAKWADRLQHSFEALLIMLRCHGHEKTSLTIRLFPFRLIDVQSGQDCALGCLPGHGCKCTCNLYPVCASC